jgi:hypothetical protein
VASNRAMIKNFFFMLVILSGVIQFICFLEGREARMFIKETLINANDGLTTNKSLIFNVIK